jgi:hypothetical protein
MIIHKATKIVSVADDSSLRQAIKLKLKGNKQAHQDRQPSLTQSVTDLQGPPSGRTQSDKIRDLKSLAKQYARDQGSCDDTRISYLEYVESEAEADWTLARMIAG